ncbi:hypothetical protein GIB67_014497 [Kingdonia uniflora]|uniref:GrpE protein homolog n=1 Tax=Kingdonia uniflora TaxID=39325 RepID=A0A7J7LZ91_9MAGN|nr:hypothetical protein GIB67_014497 [Kingdonia uniflora]
MAVAFSSSHHYLSFAPRISSYSNPNKTLEIKSLSITQQSHLLNKSCLGFPIARRSFISSVRIEESEPQVSDGKYISNLKTLLDAYKEALLDGDEKSVLEIEATIYAMENEKNELALKVSTLASDISSGKEKSIRLQADFENFRKRTEKDRLKVSSNAKEEVIESLLPVVDNFEIAKRQIKPETEKEKKIDTSYQGIYKQCVETLRSLQVAVVETVGKPFDPAFHEAIAREECQEFKEGIIIEEVRRGFLLGNRLLRSAKVKVSAGPAAEKGPANNEPVEQPATVLD